MTKSEFLYEAREIIENLETLVNEMRGDYITIRSFPEKTKSDKAAEIIWNCSNGIVPDTNGQPFLQRWFAHYDHVAAFVSDEFAEVLHAAKVMFVVALGWDVPFFDLGKAVRVSKTQMTKVHKKYLKPTKKGLVKAKRAVPWLLHRKIRIQLDMTFGGQPNAQKTE